MKVKLLLEDIINKAGIDPNEVKLLRHKAEAIEECKQNDMVKEFTAVQKTGFAKKFKYWMVFIGGAGSTAILDSFYEVHNSEKLSSKFMPKGFPVPERYELEGHSFFNLKKRDDFEKFENKLIINWGKSRGWHHNANSSEKEVLAIQAIKKYEFPGYENIILSYSELSEIISDELLYGEWHDALKAVYGVYLITDKESGKHYVGSASGDEKILQRWTNYVDSGHGGNKGLIELLDEKGEDYKYHFQFSILQIFSPLSTENEVLDAEKNFKKKLCSKKWGYNEN